MEYKNPLAAEAFHFAALAARELEAILTEGFFEDDITVEPCGGDDGTPFIVVTTSSASAAKLTKRFSDSLTLTEGKKTHEVSLIIRPFGPREAMI